MRTAMFALAVFLAAVPASSQMPKDPPGKPDVSRVTAGSYSIEPRHTQIRFTVMHFGFTPFSGFFSGASGTLTLDPAKPNAASVSIEVPTNTALVTVPKLTDELRSPMFFDPDKYPTMTFVSDKVVVHGTHATISGQLTLHGQTHPLTLEASFVGAGTSMGKRMVGFTATGTLKRSDFGITAVLPLVSDEVKIDIAAAFQKPE
jgi:polyisoprenoid-binding protein YceI